MKKIITVIILSLLIGGEVPVPAMAFDFPDANANGYQYVATVHFEEWEYNKNTEAGVESLFQRLCRTVSDFFKQAQQGGA